MREFLLIAWPVAMNAPLSRAQSQPSAPLVFDAPSVKPNNYGETLRASSMILPGGRLTATKTRLMLRRLLAERFKLSIRRETKEMPVYELEVARNGLKLDLALMLSSYSDRPVLDKTAVQGVFDLNLQWNPFADRVQSPEAVQRSPQAEAREGP
jgi:hypothetical protein